MADCVVRVAAVKRTFTTTTGPANGATWCIHPVTALKTWDAQPDYAYADSTDAHGITVTASGAGDVRYLEITIPQSVFTSDWWVSPFNFVGFDVSYFSGGGYDTGAGSNDWFVHRKAKVQQSPLGIWGGGRENAETSPVSVFWSARSQVINGLSSAWDPVTAWEWVLPDTSTVTTQSVEWALPIPIAGGGCVSSALEAFALGLNGGDPFPAFPGIWCLTTNLASKPDINNATGVSYADEDVTLSGTDSYDKGWNVTAYTQTFGVPASYVGIKSDTRAKTSTTLIYEWEIRDSGGTLVHTDSAATFTVTLSEGDYSAKLWVTDSWGYSTRCIGSGVPNEYDQANLYPRSPVIASIMHPGGVLLTALKSPDTAGAVQVYRFNGGAGTREDLDEVTLASNPSMWLTDSGTIIMQVEPSGSSSPTRISYDMGATFTAV